MDPFHSSSPEAEKSAAATMKPSVTNSKSTAASTTTASTSPMVWVDHLPESSKNHSLDTTATTCNTTLHTELETTYNQDTESCEVDVDLDNEAWVMETTQSDSEHCHVLIPHYLLIEQDPRLQHELAVHSVCSNSCDDHSSLFTNTTNTPTSNNNNDHSTHPHSSSSSSSFQHSLQQLLEQRRRQLATSMQASRRTRQVLTSHIRQRAGLSNVLQQIERSSWTIQEHLQFEQPVVGETPTASSAAATAEEEEQLPEPPAVLTTSKDDDDDDDDDVAMDIQMDDLEMADMTEGHGNVHLMMAMDTTTSAMAEDDFANSILNVPHDDDEDL